MVVVVAEEADEGGEMRRGAEEEEAQERSARILKREVGRKGRARGADLPIFEVGQPY